MSKGQTDHPVMPVSATATGPRITQAFLPVLLLVGTWSTTIAVRLTRMHRFVDVVAVNSVVWQRVGCGRG